MLVGYDMLRQEKLARHVGKTCWQDMLTRHVGKTCWQDMLARHVFRSVPH